MATGNLASLDFEEGNVTDFSGSTVDSPGTLAASTTQAVAGTYSAKLVAGGTGRRVAGIKTFTNISLDDTYNFRWYMWMAAGDGQPNTSAYTQFQTDSVNGSSISFTMDGSGDIINLFLWDGHSSQGIVWEVAFTFNHSAWNCIEVALKCHATVGGGQVWVNGDSIGSAFNLDTSGFAGAINQILIGSGGWQVGLKDGGIMYLDAIEISDEGYIGLLTSPLLHTPHYFRGGFNPASGGFAS